MPQSGRWLKRLKWFTCVIALCLGSTTVRGDNVNLGMLSYDVFIPGSSGSPGVDAFNLANLTGAFSLPPDFPVTDALTFLGATLTLTPSGQAPEVIHLGNIGPGFLLDAAGNPVVQVASNQTFSSAEFASTLSASAFRLSDGLVFAANSTSIDVTLRPSIGPTLMAGIDLSTIDVAGSVVTPEPGSAWLTLPFLLWLAYALRKKRALDKPSRS